MYTNLGRYRVIKKIGEGGMGEVYLAEDSSLSRRVALKTLPAKVADNAERLHRFIHEAKTASALNHPNIITIYEISDQDEVPFIAMEFVDGETLGKFIKKKAFDLSKFLDIAIQASAALAAAHEANVIHRDIKPDNIILRTDGLVKVLDFGLAKLSEPHPPLDSENETPTHVLTSPGMVVGTAGYMSPEQARGRKVDARSDIFSLGAVLYQMISGRKPFTGENEVDVIAAILHKEPVPLNTLVPDVHYEIDALVQKAMRKNVDERYQSVRELLSHLMEIRQDLGLNSGHSIRNGYISGQTGPAHDTEGNVSEILATNEITGTETRTLSNFIYEEARQHPIRSTTVALAIFVGLIVAWIAFDGFLPWTGTTDPFQRMRLSKLTTTGNLAEEHVALSPDGKYIAYVIRGPEADGIWLKQVAASSTTKLVEQPNVRFRSLAFSSDSEYLHYVMIDKSGASDLYQIPVFGGEPKKLFPGVGNYVAISADDRQLSFVRNGTELITANIDGTGERVLAKSENGHRWVFSAWSQKGEKIAAVSFSTLDSFYYVYEVSLNTGEKKPLGAPWLNIGGVTWLKDDSGVLLSSRDFETQLSQIWMVSYPDGTPRRITNDLSGYYGVSISANNDVIAGIQQTRLANIWLLESGENGTARRITSDVGKNEGLSGVAPVPDGRIVYTTRIYGTMDIWITDPESGENLQLTKNMQENFSPAVSPDGKYILFVSTRAGGADIWRMDIDGANPLRLTDDPGLEGEPQITPDGQWVIYDITDQNGTTTIWKININGGTPARLVETESARPEISPDGLFFACDYGHTGSGHTPKLAIFPIEGGDPINVLDFPKVLRSRVFKWSPDGKSIIYIDEENKVYDLWSQPIDGGPPKRLSNFGIDRIYRFNIAYPTGSFILSRGNETTDAVMISNFR